MRSSSFGAPATATAARRTGGGSTSIGRTRVGPHDDAIMNYYYAFLLSFVACEAHAQRLRCLCALESVPTISFILSTCSLLIIARQGANRSAIDKRGWKLRRTCELRLIRRPSRFGLLFSRDHQLASTFRESIVVRSDRNRTVDPLGRYRGELCREQPVTSRV